MLSREIEIFRAVMTSGSATRAARLLGVSQPAVSLALRRLEERAGMVLFHRTSGKLQATEEAVALMADVQRHFVGMEVIEHRIRTLKQGGSGRVRLASFPGFGAGFVPRVLADLAATGSSAMVALQIMGSQEVRGQVLRDEADFGIAARDVSVSGVEHALFAHYFGIVALPAGHPLASEPILTPRQLARYPCVLLPPDDAVSVRLDAICRRHGVALRPAVETAYTFSQCELVRNGLGIAVVNPVTAVDYLGAGIVFRPFSESLPFTALTMWPAGRTLGSFVGRMLGAMRARMETDMDLLRARMAPRAHGLVLHQFHELDASDGEQAGQPG